ncbi:MAG: T9SS type A sorting domain-containing protein [Bacteroidales bacterium]|nr:T9SS type A sorting domain-containing protein [Bacteroidales bacterium]
MISVFTGSSPGGNVIVKANTCCSNYCQNPVTILSNYLGTYWDCDEEYYLSPNPASEIVTITLKKSSLDVMQNTNCEVRILDLYGNILFSGTRSGNSFTIPVSNLKDGNYIIQISNGINKSNLKLVIKH